jgi:hypothetical protein
MTLRKDQREKKTGSEARKAAARYQMMLAATISDDHPEIRDRALAGETYQEIAADHQQEYSNTTEYGLRKSIGFVVTGYGPWGNLEALAGQLTGEERRQINKEKRRRNLEKATRTKEVQTTNGSLGGAKTHERNKGIFDRSTEQHSLDSRAGWKESMGTPEQRSAAAQKAVESRGSSLFTPRELNRAYQLTQDSTHQYRSGRWKDRPCWSLIIQTLIEEDFPERSRDVLYQALRGYQPKES